jgi:UDP-N-acetylmuramoyl-tripeptide--D-alanyl-D-alanine ligase
MITVKNILKATKARTKMMDCVEFTGITTDSRGVKPGELFVALRGENFDGHDYCATALAAGAAGVLAENTLGLPEDKVLLVNDTLAAYQNIAHVYRKSLKNVRVVAITGSNGKTSTKDLISACLATRYKVAKTEANFNNEIGIPKTLLTISPDTDIAVVEMGMRGFGQIRALKALAEPDVVVVTNVGETHMELLGSLENIARAKSEILEDLLPENIAILNGDDYYVSRMKTDAKIITYGIIAGNIIQGKDIRISGKGTSFSYTSINSGNSGHIDLPLIGEHNVMNALAAIAVAETFGVTVKDITKALNNVKLTEKRQQILHFGSITAINDAYNASPASMEAAFKTLQQLLRTQKQGRGVAVLADMLELGENSRAAHTKVGRFVAEAGTKLLITYGKEAKFISWEAARLGVEVIQCNSNKEAATELKNNIKDYDIVLFKGSHSMAVDKVIDMVFAK